MTAFLLLLMVAVASIVSLGSGADQMDVNSRNSCSELSCIDHGNIHTCYLINTCSEDISVKLIQSPIDYVDGSNSAEFQLLSKEIKILPDMNHRYIYQETKIKSGQRSLVIPVLNYAQHYAKEGNVNGEKLVMRALKGSHRMSRADYIDYVCLLPPSDPAWQKPVQYKEEVIRKLVVKPSIGKVTAKCENKGIAVPLNRGWVNGLFTSILGSGIHLEKVGGKWYLINTNRFSVQVYLSDPFSGQLIAKEPIKLEPRQATIVNTPLDNLAIKFFTHDSQEKNKKKSGQQELFFISNEKPVCIESGAANTVQREKKCISRWTFDYGCLKPDSSQEGRFKVLSRKAQLKPPALPFGRYTGTMMCISLPTMSSQISVAYTDAWINQVKWFQQ